MCGDGGGDGGGYGGVGEGREGGMELDGGEGEGVVVVAKAAETVVAREAVEKEAVME